MRGSTRVYNFSKLFNLPRKAVFPQGVSQKRFSIRAHRPKSLPLCGGVSLETCFFADDYYYFTY